MNRIDSTPSPFGEQLRHWRRRRRLSQEDLAGLADISARHLSFLETGRSAPSRAMLLRLTDRLEVPLRERNRMFTAAGFAPLYGERPLDHAGLETARRTIERLLRGHEPFPALAIDRHWRMHAANRALAPFLLGVAPELLQPPINVLRLSLHPQGVAPRVANLGQWRAHLLHRLQQQLESSGDSVLEQLLEELRGYPGAGPEEDPEPNAIAIPLRLRSDFGELSFISTTTVFGTPVEVILSELAIESFFPADPHTAEVMRALPLEGPMPGFELPPPD
ncbi:helix-turn-helix domain-containing protein [Lysobacter maris]|uniref:Helix-turn-helix domain-containing protein n=1 Tax=Marilutibacter maris TaxID=1605891 RepID=A0A508B7E8_9GAMM|nr:helix-turn-helix transcriptional regulator [Lysobacter maris]KAB8198122.1 helix-turn-helix domain-containing protein [Lysobacter maris]